MRTPERCYRGEMWAPLSRPASSFDKSFLAFTSAKGVRVELLQPSDYEMARGFMMDTFYRHANVPRALGLNPAGGKANRIVEQEIGRWVGG